MPVRLLQLIEDTSLADELAALKSLHELATNWDDLRTHFRGFTDINDVLGLVNALATRTEEIITALESQDSVELEIDALHAAAKFFNRLQDVDPTVRKLLSNVHRFGETGADDPPWGDKAISHGAACFGYGRDRGLGICRRWCR